jgi:ketosteroid isomerase-like protein
MSSAASLEDRVAIRELVSSYGDAVSRLDDGELGAMWAEDATWVHPFFGEIRGRLPIAAMQAQSMTHVKLLVFRSELGWLQIHGDTALGRTWTSELVVAKEGSPAGYAGVHTGLYEDEYVKKVGRWYFQRRKLNILHSAR